MPAVKGANVAILAAEFRAPRVRGIVTGTPLMPSRAPDDAPDRTRALLARSIVGERAATDELFSVLYDELRGIAHGYLREEREGHTLVPTALVHEAWSRLAGAVSQPGFESRAHFMRIAARAMRRVLVDHARGRERHKRGRDADRIPLDQALDAAVLCEDGRALDLIALDEALVKLAEHDAELARLIELRWFGGLSIADAARVLEVSNSSVERGWRVARLWLARELDIGESPS